MWVVVEMAPSASEVSVGTQSKRLLFNQSNLDTDTYR